MLPQTSFRQVYGDFNSPATTDLLSLGEDDLKKFGGGSSNGDDLFSFLNHIPSSYTDQHSPEVLDKGGLAFAERQYMLLLGGETPSEKKKTSGKGGRPATARSKMVRERA